MGKKDTTSKALTRNNDVFAELFNVFLFKKNVIDPKTLVEKDSTEVLALIEPMITEQKYRDILKRAEIKTDGKSAYLLLGIENQSEIHYAMVIRTMLYDALNYSAQMAEIGRKVNEKGRSEYSSTEWLSKFPKGQKIMPVITLVLCWKPDKWDAPTSLYEMMDPEIVKKYGKWINDYKLNLVSVCDLSDKELAKAKTEIGPALEFLKYSNDPKRLKEFQNDLRFRNMSEECVATINEMAGTEFPINKKGGTDMCEGIRKLQEEAAKKAAEEATKKAQDEAIISVYQKMRQIHPEDSESETIKFLAKAFNRTQKAIRTLVL